MKQVNSLSGLHEPAMNEDIDSLEEFCCTEVKGQSSLVS